MKLNFHRWIIPLCVGVVAASCVDNNYDLSDIDTTTELKVNNLTIPVNLKDVQLESIIDVDEDDPNATIKYAEFNGQKVYAITKTGHFDAKPSNIKPLHAPAPENVDNTVVTINGMPHNANQIRGRRLPALPAMRYEITRKTTSFTYHVGAEQMVDDAIKSVNAVTFSKKDPMKIKITFFSNDLASFADHVSVTNLTLLVPDGLEVSYKGKNSENGKIVIDELNSTDPQLTVELSAILMNFDKSPEGTLHVVDNSFNFTAEVGFESGDFFVYPKSNIAVTDMPSTIVFEGKYDISGFTADSFSGEIEYKTQIDPIKAIELDELPDFLSGNQTDFILENPQLFLEVNNPLAAYNVSARSGLTLTAKRDNGSSKSESLDQFVIGTSAGDKPFGILIAPDPEGEYVKSDFKTAEPYQFKGLRNILSGEGIPNTIDVALESSRNPEPMVYGKTKNFPLGSKIDNIVGNYEFFTPFALADGSTIVYSKAIDGWNDEDVDAIEITELTVNAQITTDIPAGITLIAWPLDKNGNKIEDCKAEASVSAKNIGVPSPLVLSMKGIIRNLDGIFIEAIANDFNGKALSPSQYIRLSDIRATVSGSYTKKL